MLQARVACPSFLPLLELSADASTLLVLKSYSAKHQGWIADGVALIASPWPLLPACPWVFAGAG